MLRIDPGAFAAQAQQVSTNAAGRGAGPGGHPAPAAHTPQQPDNAASAATVQVRRDLAHLQTINDRQNRIAAQARQDDQQLRQSDQLLTQMKRMLFRIIKNYPPYPPGEPERVKFLRSFNGLRQQIEQLTIPPEETWKGPLPGGRPQQAAGPGAATAYGIPALPDMADDVHIETTVVLIDTAQADLARKQADITAQAAQRGRMEGYGAKTDELAGRMPAADLTVSSEEEAADRSGEAGSGLEQAGTSITETDMQPLLAALAG